MDLAHRAYAATGAEAAICTSNQQLTLQAGHGLERRGTPAYGAV